MNYGIIVILVSCFLVAIFREAESTCTFPDGLRGTWISSKDGQLTFNDTYMSGWSSATHGNLDYECMSVSGDKYALRSTSSVKYQTTLDIYVYLCFVLTEVTAGYSFYYYLGSEQVAQSNNERLIVQFTQISVSNSDVCNRATFETGTYDFLMKEGGISNAKLQCPDELIGTHNYTNNFGTQCQGDTYLDVCTDKTALVFDNSNCSQIQAYSVNGSLNCVYQATAGSYVYVTVYNNDATTDESTTYRFTCYVVSTVLSNLSATQYPQHCESGQTPWNVSSPGFDIFLVTTDECETTVVDNSLSAGVIAAIVICSLVFIVVVVLLIYLCYRFRKKLRAKWKKFRTRYLSRKIQTEISTQTPHEKDTQTGSSGKWSWGATSPSAGSGVRREKSIILHVGNNGRLMGFTPVDAPATVPDEGEKDRKSWYAVREKSEIVISKDGTLVDLKTDKTLPPGPLLVNDSSSDSEIRLLSEDEIDGEKKLSFVIVSRKNIEPRDKESRKKTKSKKQQKRDSDDHDSSDSESNARIMVEPIDNTENRKKTQLKKLSAIKKVDDKDSSDSDAGNGVIVVKGRRKLKTKKKKSIKRKEDKKGKKKSKKKGKNDEEENEVKKKKKKSLKPLKKSRPAPATGIAPVESTNSNSADMLSAHTTDIINNIENSVKQSPPDVIPVNVSSIQNGSASDDQHAATQDPKQFEHQEIANKDPNTQENNQRETKTIISTSPDGKTVQKDETVTMQSQILTDGDSNQHNPSSSQKNNSGDDAVRPQTNVTSQDEQKQLMSSSDEQDISPNPLYLPKSQTLSHGKPQAYLYPSNDETTAKNNPDQTKSRTPTSQKELSKTKGPVQTKSNTAPVHGKTKKSSSSRDDSGITDTARSKVSDRQKGSVDTPSRGGTSNDLRESTTASASTGITPSKTREKSFDAQSYLKLKKENTIADYEASVEGTRPPSKAESNKNSIFREKILSQKEEKGEKEESGRKKYLSVWQGSAKGSRRK